MIPFDFHHAAQRQQGPFRHSKVSPNYIMTLRGCSEVIFHLHHFHIEDLQHGPLKALPSVYFGTDARLKTTSGIVPASTNMVRAALRTESVGFSAFSRPYLIWLSWLLHSL